MTVDLFAGIPVSDFVRAREWYERLLGAPPSFLPNEVEAVWEVAEHRYLYIELRPERAGRAVTTLYVDDLDERVEGARRRGVTSDDLETYEEGRVRKYVYRDADGNETCFGGAGRDAA